METFLLHVARGLWGPFDPPYLTALSEIFDTVSAYVLIAAHSCGGCAMLAANSRVAD